MDWGARVAVQREVGAAGLLGEVDVGSQGFVGHLRWSETPRRLQWKIRRRLQIDEEDSCLLCAVKITYKSDIRLT